MTALTRFALLLSLALVLLGCSASNGAGNNGAGADGADSNGAGTTTSIFLGNPGTLVPPTTEPPPNANADNLLPIETVVAFLDACVADSGLVGPCHCAAKRLDASFTPEDIQVFEDRITGQLEYPPQVAVDLVTCRQEPPPPPWDETMRQNYVRECAKGSELLVELCKCSLGRAQDIVPAGRLGEYLVAIDARPDFADLINLCL